MIVKVCGMREQRNVDDVVAAGADWIGMIFWRRSPRCVGTAHINTPPGVTRVGVFVDEQPDTVARTAADRRLDIVQLHGAETPAMIDDIRKALDAVDTMNATDGTGTTDDTHPARPRAHRRTRIMKVVSVAATEDIDRWRNYDGRVDLLLFDTRCNTTGGSGRQFDWNALCRYDGRIPFLLSGGIGPGDAERVRRVGHPALLGVDLNSRFETAPGTKDPIALRTFINKIKKPDAEQRTGRETDTPTTRHNLNVTHT